MTEHEWAQYIQQYKPETEADAIEFLQTLFEYSNIANMEAQVAEFKAEGVGRKFPSTKELHTYKGICLLSPSDAADEADSVSFGDRLLFNNTMCTF